MNPTHAEYGLIAALMAASGIHGLVDEGDPIRLTRTTPEEYEARAPGHYLPGDNLCLWGKRRIVIWETAISGLVGQVTDDAQRNNLKIIQFSIISAAPGTVTMVALMEKDEGQ